MGEASIPRSPYSSHLSPYQNICPLFSGLYTPFKATGWPTIYSSSYVPCNSYLLSHSKANHRPIVSDLPAAAHLRPRHGFVSHSGGHLSFPCRLWTCPSRKFQSDYNSDFLPSSHRSQPEHAERPLLPLLSVGCNRTLPIDKFALHFSLRPSICAAQ